MLRYIAIVCFILHAEALGVNGNNFTCLPVVVNSTLVLCDNKQDDYCVSRFQ